MQTKKYTDLLFRDITSLGGSVFYIIIMLMFLFIENFGIFNRLFVAYVLSLAITVLIRALYFRKRPKKEKFTNFIERIDASSFPSTHAQRVIILIMVLGLFLNNDFIFAFLLMIGLLTIYSRIYFKKHYLSDVIVGIIIGVILGTGVLYYL